MITVKIPKITINPFEAFRDDNLREILEDQETAVKNALSGVYDAIVSGQQDLAYWDSSAVTRPGYNYFMRCALHRSPRTDASLQLSVMEIRNNNIIPTSHREYCDLQGFLRDVISDNITSVTFLKII